MVASIVILSLPQMGFRNLLPRWLTILLISRDALMMLVALIIVLMVGWRFFKRLFMEKRVPPFRSSRFWRCCIATGESGTVPQLQILYYITGGLTAFSGLHYLVTGRDRVGIE
jgi:hypothetical protein